MSPIIILLMLIFPSLMIGLGILWKKYPPERINGTSGYRTKRSVSSEAAWQLTHRYLSTWWLILGSILAFFSVLSLLFLHPKLWDPPTKFLLWFNVIQQLSFCIPIFLTNAKLRKTFHVDGTWIKKE